MSESLINENVDSAHDSEDPDRRQGLGCHDHQKAVSKERETLVNTN